MDERFWSLADQLLSECEIVVDRPKGTAHPRWPDLIYPLDYGYLEGTSAMDGGGIDLWRGSLPGRRVTGAIMTLDVRKQDAEVKLLVSCTPAEAEMACQCHNAFSQGGLLILRSLGGV